MTGEITGEIPASAIVSSFVFTRYLVAGRDTAVRIIAQHEGHTPAQHNTAVSDSRQLRCISRTIATVPPTKDNEVRVIKKKSQVDVATSYTSRASRLGQQPRTIVRQPQELFQLPERRGQGSISSTPSRASRLGQQLRPIVRQPQELFQLSERSGG